MKLHPPIQTGTRLNCQRYLARINSVEHGVLVMTIWEWFGDRKGYGREYFSNIKLRTAGISHGGKFWAGTPAEIWTWNELLRGKLIERLHIEGEYE